MSKAILTSIRIPSDIHNYIDKLSKEDDRTFTYIATKMLSEYISSHPNKVNINSETKGD